MSRTTKAGFSLIEALVAVTLVGGGIAAMVSAMGATDKTEARLLRSEKLQRFAEQKLDEIVATQDFNVESGDFSDQGEPTLEWTMTDDTTGVENLDQVTVTVTLSGDSQSGETVTTLLYRAPTNTGTGGGQ